jgi:hypothetical protein
MIEHPVTAKTQKYFNFMKQTLNDSVKIFFQHGDTEKIEFHRKNFYLVFNAKKQNLTKKGLRISPCSLCLRVEVFNNFDSFKNKIACQKIISQKASECQVF